MSEHRQEAGSVAQRPESVVKGTYGKPHSTSCKKHKVRSDGTGEEGVLFPPSCHSSGPCRDYAGEPGVGMVAGAPPCPSPMARPDIW